MDSLSKLAPSFIEGLGESEAFFKRKLIYRRNEINLACLLIMAYSDHSNMMLHRAMLVKGYPSYDVLEKTLDAFNTTFDEELTPADVMHSGEECANKSLEDYQSYCEIVGMLGQFGIDKDEVDEFCKRLDEPDNMRLMMFPLRCLLYYDAYCKAIFYNLSGEITYEQMFEVFTGYADKLEFTDVDRVFRDFVRDLRALLDLLYEIHEEREGRSEEEEVGSEA